MNDDGGDEQLIFPIIPDDRHLTVEEIQAGFNGIAGWKRRRSLSDPEIRYMRFKHKFLHKDLVQQQPIVEAPQWALELRRTMNRRFNDMQRQNRLATENVQRQVRLSRRGVQRQIDFLRIGAQRQIDLLRRDVKIMQLISGSFDKK